MDDDLPRTPEELQRAADSFKDLPPEHQLGAEEVAELVEEVTGEHIPVDLAARRERLLEEKRTVLNTMAEQPHLDLDEELDRINQQLATLGQHPTHN